MNSKEIKELDEKFEGSHVLIELNILVSPQMAQSIYSLTINDNQVVNHVVEFAKKYSIDLQELFESGEYIYLTSFVKPDNIEWLKIVDEIKNKYPSFVMYWESSKNKIEDILISFPTIDS